MTVVNGESFTSAQFAGYGYLGRLFDLSDALVAVAGQASDDADTVAADKATVAADRASSSSSSAAAETYRDEAESAAAAAQAAAAAAEGGFPFTTTSGTGAAYTADFTPDVTVADGVSFQLVIHTSNTTTTPTLSVEGGTAYTMVIGVDRRPIPVGLLTAGNSITATYNATNTEYVITGGTPLFEFNRNIDAREYELQESTLVNTAEKINALGNVSGAVAIDASDGHYVTMTLTGNATSLTISNWRTSSAPWMTIKVTQDGTGGRTLALGSAYKTPGGTGITLSTGAGDVDTLHLWSDDGGTTVYVTANLNWS
jgi:hypothetical protein